MTLRAIKAVIFDVDETLTGGISWYRLTEVRGDLLAGHGIIYQIRRTFLINRAIAYHN